MAAFLQQNSLVNKVIEFANYQSQQLACEARWVLCNAITISSIPSLKTFYMKQTEDLVYPLIEALKQEEIIDHRLLAEVIKVIDKLLSLDLIYP